MSKQTFPEVLVNDIADGTQILNSSTETIICPDFQFSANDSRIYPGAALSVECYFDCSFVITTPGTLTLRLRWGGVSGSVLAASGAYAPDPTSALTTRSGYVKFDTTWRTTGAAGTAMTMGFMHINDFDDASATTLQGNLNMGVIPSNTPAVVSSLDTTAAKALSVTAQFSVSTTGTQLTNHLRRLTLWN
jgi:hypothetical protein